VKAVLFLCLLVAACVPARLEKHLVKDRDRRANPADLARAFDGAEDEAAIRSLGNWIEDNYRTDPPPSPPGYRVSFARQSAGVFAPDYFDHLEPASR
jgi:hypothetical protein